MTVQERIRAYIRFKKLSVSEFCRTLDVSTAYVSSMSKSMSLKVIQRISITYPDLNIQWLQTGEGEMIKRPEEETEVLLDVVSPCRECDRKDGKIELLMDTVRDLQKQLSEVTAAYNELLKSCDSEKGKNGKGKNGGKSGGSGSGSSDTISPHFWMCPMASNKKDEE